MSELKHLLQVAALFIGGVLSMLAGAGLILAIYGAAIGTVFGVAWWVGKAIFAAMP